MEKNLILDDKYIIKNKISFGGTSKVYLVEDIKKSQIFACKILDTENKFFKNEINILCQISHKNVVNIIDSGEGRITGKNPNKKYFYIILEYCENQTLFNYIFYTKQAFGEQYGKYIFNIILDTINDIHNMGFVHRDIKTENILLDKQFNIKISDFGYSTSLEDEEGNKRKLKTILGTKCFLAPEMLDDTKEKKYDGKKVDIYALGILLSGLVCGTYIFESAKITDKNYSLIYNKNYNDFISKFEKIFKDIKFSKDFIDLFINMVKKDPNERFNYNQIKNHPWMKNIEIDNEKMVKEFKRRDFYVRSRIDDEEVEIESNNNNEEENEQKIFRNENNLKSYYSINNKIKIIDENLIKNIIKIKFSINIQNEVQFMNSITNLIYNNEKKIIIQSQKNLSFKIIYENEEEEEEEDENNEIEFEIVDLIIKIELVKNNKKKYYFLFKKKSGDYEQFLTKTEKLKKLIKNYIINNY